MIDSKVYDINYTASTVSVGLIVSQLLGGMQLAHADQNPVGIYPALAEPAYQLVEAIDSSNETYPLSYELTDNDLLGEINTFYSNLLAKQERLGKDIEELLYSNLENLYET